MKLRFIYFVFVLGALMMILQSRSGGAAANNLGDRTGSPLGSAAGCSCHGGGSYSPSLAISVKDTAFNTVSEYIPGEEYTIEFNATSTSGNPAGYGFQGIAITPNGFLQAGTVTASITSNTQVIPFSGRSIVEHQGVSSSGVFQVSWTAPAVGFGNVNIYGRALAVDGTGGTGGDNQSTSTLLTLSEASSINYTQTSYCPDELDPTPTIVGTPGGVFSASPSGLVINSTTGVIDLSTSVDGQTYTITYTYGGSNTTTDVLTIVAADDPSFSYGTNVNYCQNDIDPTPTITGLSGGTFSSATGLSINSATGVIDLSASVPNSYNVTYLTNGPCPSSQTVSITINSNDIASFTYGGTTFCQNSIDPTPVAGTLGGTWSSTSGLAINSLTGVIDVSASTPNNYMVTYTTNGICPDSDSLNITIVAGENASFSLNDSIFCQNGVDAVATISGTLGGTFSSTNGLTINSVTGTIDVSTSIPSTYDVTYTTGGTCSDLYIVPITIYAVDNASFTYGNNVFCENGTDPVPIALLPGGVWGSGPGLVLDSLTGIIDLSASVVGPYTISYITNGTCPDSSSLNITINPNDSAAFPFTDTTLCQNIIGTNPVLAVAGATSGIYSANPPSLVFADSITGEIDLAASAPGLYLLTYTSNGTCPVIVNANVTLTICTGLSNFENSANFSLFPNPNQGIFSIQNSGPTAEVEFLILDILGKVVFKDKFLFLNHQKRILDFSTLSNSTYFVQIIRDGQLQTIKLHIH